MNLTRKLGETKLACFTIDETRRIQNIINTIEQKSTHNREEHECHLPDGSYIYECRFPEEERIKVDIRIEHSSSSCHILTHHHVVRADDGMSLFRCTLDELINSDFEQSAIYISLFHDGPWVDRFCKKSIKNEELLFGSIDF